jgi:hypothetical protein
MPVLVFTKPQKYNRHMTENTCVCEDSNCQIPHGFCHCGCGNPTEIEDQPRYDKKGRYGWPRMWCRGHNRRSTWDSSICVCGFQNCLIPFGTCHCGCGEKTRIASVSQVTKRWHRGEPMPYLAGHAIRGKKIAKKPQNETRKEIVEGIPCIWILLSKNQWGLICESDYELVRTYRWHCVSGYAYTTLPDCAGNLAMHCLIMGVPQGTLIDHENRKRWDNRRNNLRPATTQQNRFNLSVSRRNKTGWRGISEMPNSRYRVRINIGGKEIHLAVVKGLEKAIQIRMAAEEKYYGEFRRTA